MSNNVAVRFLKAIYSAFVSPPEVVGGPTTIVKLGEFTVNYGETIAEKIADNTDPKRIGWCDREWTIGVGEKFPDKRKGKKRLKASAVKFGRTMSDADIVKWCANNKKICATPKEGIDLALASPRPKLDNVMPLALAGQFFADAGGSRNALYFNHDSNRRALFSVWLRTGEQWDDYWWFLVLEEISSAA